MNSSLPIILSDVGGCFEIIDNNGYLVKNKVNQIKNAILSCIKDIDYLGRKSKDLFDEKFNLELAKNEYLDYYKEVLNH